MQTLKWLIFGCVLGLLAFTWNGEEVEHIGMKIAFFLHDLFMK